MDLDSGAPLPPSPDILLDRLRALVTESPDRHIQLVSGTLFARLKVLNRDAHAAVRAHKALAAEARTGMDQTQLGLQNLQYEKRHLEREIEKCRQFASVYEDVPIHSAEEYIKIAPPELRTSEVVNDQHQFMLTRLNFELAERQKLEARRKELAKQKEDLLKVSKTKQATAEAVKAQLDALMKSATDIQKKVDELVPAPPAMVQVEGTPEVTETIDDADVQMES